MRDLLFRLWCLIRGKDPIIEMGLDYLNRSQDLYAVATAAVMLGDEYASKVLDKLDKVDMSLDKMMSAYIALSQTGKAKYLLEYLKQRILSDESNNLFLWNRMAYENRESWIIDKLKSLEEKNNGSTD